MRKACVPQSKGTPRIAAFAPSADPAHGAPMKPHPVRKSCASAKSRVLSVMAISPVGAEEAQRDQRMDLCDRDQFVDQDMLIGPTHPEGRAAEDNARHAEHAVEASVGGADAHVRHGRPAKNGGGG